METKRSDVPVTGVEIEEQIFIWTIKEFPSVMKHHELVNAQLFTFRAGQSIGAPCDWEISLNFNKNDDDGDRLSDFIGIFIELTAKSSYIMHKHLIAQCVFEIRNQDGTVFTVADCGSNDFVVNSESGYFKFIKKSDVSSLPLVNGTLTIRCTFKMFGTIRFGRRMYVFENLLLNFESKSEGKAWRDMAHLVMLPTEYHGITIISSDGKEFQARKEVLEGTSKKIARSTVLEAMFRNEMKEKDQNKLELEDISSKTLEVLLHFFYTGKLLPEWKDREVIAEFTNAAVKYNMSDLVEFLDCTLGMVCNVENAAELLALTNKLEMKNAEYDLMDYIRTECVSSRNGLLKFIEGLSKL